MVFHAVATITPAPGKETRLKELMIALAGDVENFEKEVLKYEVYEQYNSEGENVLIVEETYATEAVYEAHSKTDYFQALIGAVIKEDLVVKPIDIKLVKQIAGFASR